MKKLFAFCEKYLGNGSLSASKFVETAGADFAANGVYSASVQEAGDGVCFVAKEGDCRYFVIAGNKAGDFEAAPDGIGKGFIICPLSVKNCKALMALFPFTKPTAVLGCPRTIGLGDRLGMATPGHIELIKETDFKPILAQQSMRELNLTGRDYPSVLSDAAWSVFMAGYKGGYGADGDHLKTKADITTAINAGYTMITLDCSEHIDNAAGDLADAKPDYMKLDAALRDRLEKTYLNKTFTVEGNAISFPEQLFYKTALTYCKAISFAVDVYNSLFRGRTPHVDFELSIDETTVPTLPEAHYFVANELKHADVVCQTVAPRFCGEFQKGIDYIGDLNQFKAEYAVHAAIARAFGYKISVHSGSDKFTVFPSVGELSQGRFHVKTAGTNWLEAVRIVAKTEPAFYRAMHEKAFATLEEARKYYHIKAKAESVAPISSVADDKLPEYMNEDDARQILHITYGFILQDAPMKKQLYHILYEYENVYAAALVKHIGRHVDLLNGKK